MFKRFRSLCLVPIVLSLSACAIGVSQQPYNPTSTVPLKKLVLAAQAQPPKVTVGIGGSMGLMFGGIGAGIAAANGAAEGQTLDQLISGQGLNYHQRLLGKIVANLKAAGIQAEIVPVSRKGPIDFVEDYKPLVAKNDADAVLDLVVTEASYGGTHPLLDSDLRPILKIRAKLVSTRSFEQLYGDSISFGYTNPFEKAKEIKAPQKYYFKNMDAINADRQRAAEGLGLAADEVARFIADQFISAKTAPAAR